MENLSLRDAANLCGRGKSTIQAAIKAGRLSATRNETGGYAIDPAELHRVFPFSMDTGQAQDAPGGTGQDAAFIGPPARPVLSEKPKAGQDRTGQGGDGAIYLAQMLEREREAGRELASALQARLDDMAETVADLRKRLDTAEAEKMRLLPAPDAGQGKAPAKRQGLIGRIFGGRD